MNIHTTVTTITVVDEVTVTMTREEAFKLERATAESSDMRFMNLYTLLRDERWKAEKECK